MYSYGWKAQWSHGEESSPPPPPCPHLPSSHSHLSPLCGDNYSYYFMTKFIQCLTNTEASTKVCAHLSTFFPFSHKKRCPTHPVCTLSKVFRKTVLPLWTDDFVGAVAEMGNGWHRAVAGTRPRTRNRTEFCWLSVLGPSLFVLSLGSAVCAYSRILLKSWQSSRKQFVLLSGLKSLLAILHTPLICSINLFIIDHAKVNFEPFALEMTKWPNNVKVPAQHLAHSNYFIK